MADRIPTTSFPLAPDMPNMIAGCDRAAAMNAHGDVAPAIDINDPVYGLSTAGLALMGLHRRPRGAAPV